MICWRFQELRLRLDFRRFRRLNDLNRHEFLGPLRELLLKFGRVEAGETDDEEQKANGIDVSQFSVRVAVGSRKAELSDVRAKGVTARIKRARRVHGRRGLCCSWRGIHSSSARWLLHVNMKLARP